MNSRIQLLADLESLATRSLANRPLCQNEEGTKQHLVLPALAVLGYDCSNPYELQPEYPAHFRNGLQDRVDYVILQNAEPVIAIECKKCGADLVSNRGQLRGYFTALPEVRLGLLTDGIRFEFFTDCENPNIMDYEPIQDRYSELIHIAFEEAFVMPVVEKMRDIASKQAEEAMVDRGASQRIITTDRELAVYRYVCRQLAYLATNEAQFAAIERVEYRDYVGKFVVFFGGVNKGRLFEFIEGRNGYDKFNFPAPFGEIETNTMRDIDTALGAVFAQRVRESNSGEAEPRRSVAIA